MHQAVRRVIRLLLKSLVLQRRTLNHQKRILAGQQVISDRLAKQGETLDKILTDLTPSSPGVLVSLEIEFGIPTVPEGQ